MRAAFVHSDHPPTPEPHPTRPTTSGVPTRGAPRLRGGLWAADGSLRHHHLHELVVVDLAVAVGVGLPLRRGPPGGRLDSKRCAAAPRVETVREPEQRRTVEAACCFPRGQLQVNARRITSAPFLGRLGQELEWESLLLRHQVPLLGSDHLQQP